MDKKELESWIRGLEITLGFCQGAYKASGNEAFDYIYGDLEELRDYLLHLMEMVEDEVIT
jgi:hypothetical protein